ncbi:hypothetical protein L2E82_45949 [Cichorium intybus]|uniref:Uncharacterized protein n=1 Tax=Cichorium intybus TaxID=13427 RepID=A0ACB8ZV87_CICIN|nr:hypothetical protein L2E82_45949 [Cichorium intybus]
MAASKGKTQLKGTKTQPPFVACSQPEPILYYSGTRFGLHLYNLVFYEARVHLRFWSSPSTQLTASVLGACKVVFHP